MSARNQMRCGIDDVLMDVCSLGLLYIENEKVKMKEERYCSECEDCASACAFRAITFR